MAINDEDGDYGLDCWTNAEGAGDPDQELFCDDIDELREEARKLIESGRFKFILLSRWSEADNDWISLEEITTE